jgi:ABC-type phosphate transport system permease subunit
MRIIHALLLYHLRGFDQSDPPTYHLSTLHLPVIIAEFDSAVESVPKELRKTAEET